MSTRNRATHYDEDFKRTLVNLYQENGKCTNHLHQKLNHQYPNLVLVSDFTFIKVACKWYYLYIVKDLFSRKFFLKYFI